MEDSVATPGCRYAVIGACKDGRCLLARLWDVVDRCAQEKK